MTNKIVMGICGAAAVAVIGAGGYVAASSGSGSAGPSGQAHDDTVAMSDSSFLDTAIAEADLAADGDTPGTSDQTAAPGDRHPRPPRHPLRARRFFRGLHGTATVRTKDQGFRQVAWQRGQVTSVSGSTVTVRSADGVSWQWTTNGNTKIRKKGAKASVSQLAANDWVFVIGTVDGSTRTARAAVVPKRVPKNATPAPTPTS